MDERLIPREMRVLFSHTTVVLVLLTVGYYLLPFRFTGQSSDFVRLPSSLAALALVVVALRRQARKSRRTMSLTYVRIQTLLTALYLLVLGFALLYAAIAVFGTAQFVGIDDRTDALYFSVTLVATVGFGDIHPSGTVGQLATVVHMLFNLVYLGTALRMLSTGPRPTGQSQN